MNLTTALLQAAVEYGAAVGSAAGGTQGGGGTLLDRGIDFASDNVAVVIIAVLTLLLVVGLARTRGYRS